MNKCKYFDCGWCYAPDDVKTNATQSGCFEPEHCPYLKSQNQMTNEIDISKVLIEGDTATIMGVKYKRVEEPKPPTLLHIVCEWCDDDNDLPCEELVNRIEQWLPDRIEYEDEDYDKGWKDAIRTIKQKLR